jgi:hypothetical protein
MPPLPTFDFDALADGTHLNQRETAAVLRRSVSCLENWRKDPVHPLRWQYIAGRVTYTARHPQVSQGSDNDQINRPRAEHTADKFCSEQVARVTRPKRY